MVVKVLSYVNAKERDLPSVPLLLSFCHTHNLTPPSWRRLQAESICYLRSLHQARARGSLKRI
jgi:hypothetical protein